MTAAASAAEAGGVAKVGDDQPSTVIERGRKALKRLERATWSDWVAVAKALAAGRAIIMHEVSTNAPQNSRYRKCMGEWLRHWGFDRIDKADRSRLLKVADNLDAINSWRSGLPPEQQLRLNFPATVLRAWKRANAPTDKEEQATRDTIGPNSYGEMARKLARLDELENEVVRLKRVNLALENEVEDLKVRVARFRRETADLAVDYATGNGQLDAGCAVARVAATTSEKMPVLEKLDAPELLELLPDDTKRKIKTRVVGLLTAEELLDELDRKPPGAPPSTAVYAGLKTLRKALPSPTTKSAAISGEQGTRP